jgi:FKBP-type peptidyl-prolyl cis-trans isomerase
VIVPPELGYGKQGEQEIGPNTTFELRIELLAAEA